MTELASPVRSRRLVWSIAAVVGLIALAGAGWYGWFWYTTPAPPDVPLAGVEPAVAQAVEAARAKVRRNGRSGAAWGELGQVLIVHDFAEAADACFAQAERFDPANPRWPYYQGLYRTSQHPEASIPFLRRAADLCDKSDRGNEAPRLRLAEMLIQTGAYDEAERQLGQILQWDPQNLRARYDLGALALARKDDEAAVPHFQASAASPSARRKSYSNLAMIRERQGDAAAAADYGRQAAAAPPDRTWDDRYVDEYLAFQVVRWGRLAEAERMAAEGRVQDALPILKQLAEDPSDARAKIAAGVAFYKLKQFDEAERYFRAAVGLEMEQAEANYLLALVLYAQAERLEAQGEAALAKLRESVACADVALQLKPTHVKAHLYRGLALNKLGRTAEGMESLRQAVRCGPDQVDPHLKLGEALAKDGKRDEAITELRFAVELAPADDARPRAALERILGSGEKPM